MPLNLPSLKTRRYDNAYIKGKISVLNRYLNQILHVPEILRSDILRRFLVDEYLPDDSDDDQMSSSKALLQSFPQSSVVVKKGHSFELNLEVTRADSVVTWEFRTRKYDIVVNNSTFTM